MKLSTFNFKTSLNFKLSTFHFIALLIALTFMGCQGNTYAKLLQEEKDNIKHYITANGYKVFEGDSIPSDTVWNDPKALYKVAGYDYFYFRLTKQGDTTKAPVKTSETVVLRYRRYTITQPYDTASYWTTLNSPYPLEFSFYTDYATACRAWQEACALMAYPDAECMIICPSKLGFSDEQSSVTPYGYDLRMKIKR